MLSLYSWSWKNICPGLWNLRATHHPAVYDNRQIWRIVAMLNSELKDISSDEIPLSEMDVIPKR
jgi:hypothetical protein